MSMRSSPGDGVPAWLPCSASRPRRGDLSGRIRRRSSSPALTAAFHRGAGWAVRGLV